MSDVLARICADKRREVAARKAAVSEADLAARLAEATRPRGFAGALRARRAAGDVALIAEIKKASPSRGLIRADFDPATLAAAYRAGGATCLSVLTDEPYFQGKDEYLQAARAAVGLPVLRKDFALDPYQIRETRALGADCVLLILAALTDCEVQDLCEIALDLGLDVLAEVHDAEELDRALKLPAQGAHGNETMIGVNNRNLKTLAVDLATFETLAVRVPRGRLLVAESGIKTPSDIARLERAGAAAFLVGESLMLQADVAGATRDLLARERARA
ncbi:MAG: indole-3-glycerol phosphate synthase TrpC [Rhodospirillales bacterium]|nr:indole-3-glycerol phosphate synthase TrpC [Rhodospirillales bacterium]